MNKFNVGDKVSITPASSRGSPYTFDTVVEVKKTTVKLSNGKTYRRTDGGLYGSSGFYNERIIKYDPYHEKHNEALIDNRTRNLTTHYIVENVKRVTSVEVLQRISDLIQQEIERQAKSQENTV